MGSPLPWQSLKRLVFTPNGLSHIYELPFKLSLDARLSVFQFKIHHNIL